MLLQKLIAFSYVAIAPKTANLEGLRHFESPSDLQEGLHFMCKDKVGSFMFFYVISY